MACKYAKYCGGCSLQHLSYENQLKEKQKYMESLLSRFHRVNKIIGCRNNEHYRNKMQVSFGKDERGRAIYGNYIPSTHFIVPFDECLINDEEANSIIKTVRELIDKYHISVFDENVYKGCIRHIQIRCTSTDEYMVIFVTGSPVLYKKELLIKDLIRKHPKIKTVIHNINSAHTSMVLGDKSYVIYGKGYIRDVLCGLKFNLSASSFYQINKYQTEVLYNTAIQLAEFKGSEPVIDAYSGIGTISLCLASKVKEVIGVEINEQAVRDAIRNAKLNDVTNVKFIADDAGRFMEKLSRNRKAHVDALVMDPPRSGASDRFLKSVLKLSPEKIVYISCGPESLKSNLGFLVKNGYVIKVIQPVDMFPHTDIKHTENIVILKRKEF